MAHPPFRLATLLQLRKRARDESRNGLAAAIQQEVALKAQRDALEEEIQQFQTHYQQAMRPGHLAIDRLVDASRYAFGLEQARQELSRLESEAVDELERRRDVLREAEREVRVLEMLRDKHQVAEQLIETRQENHWLDGASPPGQPV